MQAVDFETAFSNLAFTRPVYLTNARDGTDWIYVVEQGGRILVFPNDDTVTSASVFLDLSASAGGPVSRAGNEEGLLGLCFDPAYRTNGYVYVHYFAASPRRSVIARYTATFPTGAAPVATAGTFHEILSVDQPASNHNAGMLEFGPDDMLYIGSGVASDSRVPRSSRRAPRSAACCGSACGGWTEPACRAWARPGCTGPRSTRSVSGSTAWYWRAPTSCAIPVTVTDPYAAALLHNVRSSERAARRTRDAARRADVA